MRSLPQRSSTQNIEQIPEKEISSGINRFLKMGKKSKSQSKSVTEAPGNGGLPFLGSAPLDAGLSSLFEKSVSFLYRQTKRKSLTGWILGWTGENPHC